MPRNSEARKPAQDGITNRVVVITGGNSGVGFALAERLLALRLSLTICLACRNLFKAEQAKNVLLDRFPEAEVDITELDTSSVRSVSRAAMELMRRYRQIDYLFLNAGIMPNTTVNWRYLLWCVVHPTYLLDALSTGTGLLRVVDGQSEDGLKLIFATNLFGHFLLVRKLEDYLCSSSAGSRIIWTSSSNSSRKNFDMKDIQHKNGTEPYSSSKHGINIISNAFNSYLRDKGVHSHVVCPGFALTAMTHPMLGTFFWTLLCPLFMLIRIIIPSMCITPWNSAEALVHLLETDPEELDPKLLYVSHVSGCGNPHVRSKKIDFSPDEPYSLYGEMAALQAEVEGTK